MHPSVMSFLRRALDGHEVRGKSVLEVGSCDVNGSPRAVVVPLEPGSYVGVDFQAGPGVDRVVDAGRLVEAFGEGSFDLVISTEMLEHALDWRSAVRSMKRVLKPGGLLVVTARGPGFPYHGYPHDHWRFARVDFEQIFRDFSVLILQSDPEFPGVFFKGRKPDPFAETPLHGIEPSPAPAP